VVLTGEREGYYRDYDGLEDLAACLREGYAYTGRFSPFRMRRHGRPTNGIPAERFVVSIQNHDQVGNRMLGERISQLVSFDRLKLAAGAVLLSPYIPLLFMGEEYGEMAPFLYFISHTDSALVEAVRKGRRKEFESFPWREAPPDPQAEETFRLSKLDHTLCGKGPHRALWLFYQELLRLRRETPALARLDRWSMDVRIYPGQDALSVRRWYERSETVAIMSFSGSPQALSLPVPAGPWRKLLDSGDPQWGGQGAQTPGTLLSNGAAALTVGPATLVLYGKES
jgi:maltooligosyltrehalose trehalohydrolase